jgi:flavin-binding protein dodecin
MAIVKVIEVLAQSEKGWEDATQQALTQVSKSVRQVRNVYIKNFQAIVENGRIAEYRINAKVSFTVEE